MAVKRFCDFCGSEISIGNYLKMEITTENGKVRILTVCGWGKGDNFDICLSCLLSKLTIGASKLMESGKDSFTWRSGEEVNHVHSLLMAYK